MYVKKVLFLKATIHEHLSIVPRTVFFLIWLLAKLPIPSRICANRVINHMRERAIFRSRGIILMSRV